MKTDDEEQAWLKHMLAKLIAIEEDGQQALKNIPLNQQQKQDEKVTPTEVEEFLLNEKRLRRRYTIKEAAQMVGISHTLLYAAEDDGRLPKPEYRKDTKSKVRAGYTINQINHMRRVFDKAPKKPEGARAAIMGFLNLKGGSQKTTLAHFFAHYLAILGYRVLIVDTDPQGTLSFYFGKRPEIDVEYHHTFAPYLLEDDAALVEQDFPEGSSKNLKYAIQNTYWDNIDIIPSCLENLTIDLLMPELAKKAGLSSKEAIEKLRKGLVDVGSEYDFILADGTPSLNISTLNVVSACDVTFVPAPAAMSDFASTIQFISLIANTIETYETDGFFPNVPDIRYVITKYSKSSYADYMAKLIRKIFEKERGDVLKNEAHQSDEVGKATNHTVSIYEVNPSDADNRKRLKDTIAKFDSLFDEMVRVTTETCWDASSDENYLLDSESNNKQEVAHG